MNKLQTFVNNVYNDFSRGSTKTLKSSTDGNMLTLTPELIELLKAGTPANVDQGRVLQWADKALSIVRTDIKVWKDAWTMTTAEDDPKNWRLQNIYEFDVDQDAMITSQTENLINKCLKTEFSLKSSAGKIDEEQTKKLANSIGFREIRKKIHEAKFFGYSLIQMQVIQLDGGKQALKVEMLPRQNVVPKKGRFYEDYSEDKWIAYREMAEFGSYLVEIDSGTVGKFNKAIPHVLFKKFAFSCWSELCEIFGIPMRVLKTDTQNKVVLARATKMMREIGAAAWAIIDESESMEFAKAVDSNGDMFKSFKDALNNEISMLVSGVIYGQDTVNGNRSKDESAQIILNENVGALLKEEEMTQNSIIIQALIQIGFLKGDVVFEFDPTEDMDKLWTRTKDTMSEFDVDPAFITSKFGIPILGKKQNASSGSDKTKLDLGDFFA